MAGDNGDYVEETAGGIIFLSLREGTTKQSRSYAIRSVFDEIAALSLAMTSLLFQTNLSSDAFISK